MSQCRTQRIVARGSSIYHESEAGMELIANCDSDGWAELLAMRADESFVKKLHPADVPPRPARTLAQLAKLAIDVQNACNLAGIVHSWAEVVQELKNLGECAGTDAINRHPINVLFAHKLEDLSCSYAPGTSSEAYETCKRLAAGK